MRIAVAFCFAYVALVACEKRDPVADGANAAAAPAEVDVLPADESAATPTNELANGVDEGDETAEGNRVPAALHGRWGLTPGDCTSKLGDAKGLLIVSAKGLQFYESTAKPDGAAKTSGNSISGDFAFTGEGMSWKKYEALELQGAKLVRTESDPMASFTYARCTS